MLNLAKALRVKRGDVVSFVGGGGKTTSMFRLAEELSAGGLRVVTTTTTHISEDQVRFAPAVIKLEELEVLGARLDQYGHCLLIGPPDGKGRVHGASPELIEALSARQDIDVVLVEADGSRSLPFKAPGSHEPVVPQATTILSPIAGLNVLGQPLDAAHVHRAEIAAALAQQPLGSPVLPQTVARVLAHAEGGAKQLPASARLVPILNKADTEAALRHAGEAADLLLAHSGVDGVIISTMNQSPPVYECRMRVAGVVQAAGQPTRFGETKQAFPSGDATLVAHAARAALDAGLDPVVVVLGRHADAVEQALAGLPVQRVYNSDFAAGQSTVLQTGLGALPANTGAAVFLLADQPLVHAGIIRKIVRAHRQSCAPACMPVFEERRGNPVLFDRALFQELAALQGDPGGGELLDQYQGEIALVPVGRAVLLNADIYEDYRKRMSEKRTQEET